jgi:hypothetical protein
MVAELASAFVRRVWAATLQHDGGARHDVWRLFCFPIIFKSKMRVTPRLAFGVSSLSEWKPMTPRMNHTTWRLPQPIGLHSTITS